MIFSGINFLFFFFYMAVCEIIKAVFALHVLVFFFARRYIFLKKILKQLSLYDFSSTGNHYNDWRDLTL